MPRLHMIIGNANTRKSSLLRCLTGVAGGRNANQLMDILLSNGNMIRVHCIASALQESLNPREPPQFIEEVLAMNPVPADIAITLRLDARAAYPQAAAYLQAFAVQAGWQLASVALLAVPANPFPQFLATTTKIAIVPNSRSQPTNQSADAVRHAWGWV